MFIFIRSINNIESSTNIESNINIQKNTCGKIDYSYDIDTFNRLKKQEEIILVEELITLKNLFHYLCEISSIKFQIEMDLDVEIKNLFFYKMNIINIFEKLAKQYDLHIFLRDECIFVKKCPKTFNTISLEIISPSQDDWNGIEETLKKMTPNIQINKQSGLISFQCECKIQKIIRKYVEKIRQNYLRQIEIECRIVEIDCSKENPDIINSIIDGIFNIVNSSNDIKTSVLTGFKTLDEFLKKFRNVNSKISSTSKIIILNNKKGKIANQNNVQQESPICSVSVKSKKNSEKKKQDKFIHGGISIEIQNSIMDNKIFLNVDISHSSIMPNKKDFSSRKFSSSFITQNQENKVVANFDVEEICTQKSFFSSKSQQKIKKHLVIIFTTRVI